MGLVLVMFPGKAADCARRPRWLAALLLFGWLNLLIQPCQAGLPAQSAAGEHCEHPGKSDHAASCAAMQAANCELGADLNADGSPPVQPLRASGPFLLLEEPAASGAAVAHLDPVDPGGGAGPPRHLLFCKLSN